MRAGVALTRLVGDTHGTPPADKAGRAEEILRKARDRREEGVRAELREKVAAGIEAMSRNGETWAAAVNKEREHSVGLFQRGLTMAAASIRAGEFG